uniref:ChaM n=1 Tax=Streptomyces chattanoogensis TaxID=66876 RepID=A0A0A0R404_9ACTN|nr:ChaM [Streptomyces chattanoogensis]
MTAPGIDTQVVVVGAGPVGLMLAGELRLGGAGVTVLEQLAAPTTESRASTLHARTMEILEQRGLVEELGDPPNGGPGHFGGIPLDLTLPGPYPGQWKVPQARTEELLAGWATGLGAELRRGHRVVGITDRGDHVEVEVEAATPPPAGGGGPTSRRLRAQYVVGCDGEESIVRRLAGFPFPGEDATKELLRADIAGIDVPNRRFERHPRGLAIASRGPTGITRVMAHGYGTPARPRTEAPSFEEVARLWADITGEDISGGTPVWLNAFGNARRQVSRYRLGRVLLAGDAAHRQMPVGGQALNLGLQDAVNLGWKLAAHLRGTGLLDSYHAERHPVGRRVLGNIAAQALLLLGGQDVEELRSVFRQLIGLPEARAHLAGMISGLDVRYDMAGGGEGEHPLLGARLPAYRLRTAAGPAGTLGLLRSGRGVLLDLGGDPALAAAARRWADGRVTHVRAEAEPGCQGPEFGAALVRPDGHLAWIDGTPADLDAALRRWFGAPDPGTGTPAPRHRA